MKKNVVKVDLDSIRRRARSGPVSLSLDEIVALCRIVDGQYSALAVIYRPILDLISQLHAVSAHQVADHWGVLAATVWAAMHSDYGEWITFTCRSCGTDYDIWGATESDARKGLPTMCKQAGFDYERQLCSECRKKAHHDN